jgi:hypothetical protein
MKKGPESPISAQFDSNNNSVVLSETLGTYKSPEEALNKIGSQRLRNGLHLAGNLLSLTGSLAIIGLAASGSISNELRPAILLAAGTGSSILFSVLTTVRARAFLRSSEEEMAVKRLVNSQKDQSPTNL